MNKIIATRELLFSEKGQKLQKPFSIILKEPYMVSKDEGLQSRVYAACEIEVEGIMEESFSEDKHLVYGADKLQAINLASNVEPMLKRLSKKYDLFWKAGEPYFE